MSNLTGRDNTHIYYNISLTNNDTSDNILSPPVVSFTETRNQPFLNCPEDYHMSVVRFSLETPTLPVIQCQPILGANDADLLVYRVYMQRTKGTIPNTTSGSAYEDLLMKSTNSYIPTPPLPVTTDLYTSPYYSLYSHQAFVEMVNKALADVWSQLYTVSTGIPTNAIAPYLYWDVGSNTAILNVSQSLVSETDYISIYFNAPLFTLFSSFPATFETLQLSIPLVSGQSSVPLYKITIITGPNANLSASTVTVGAAPVTVYTYQILQEYTTAPLWSPIDSIVFTTSLLPSVPELVASPIIFGNNGAPVLTGQNANITTTLTDFIVPMTTGNEYKPSINYTPTGEYRLTSLFGKNPIHGIQVNVFYKDRFGNLIPVTLATGCSGSLKILFRRKDFSNLIIE